MSTIGKIIFYALGPVLMVMFPLISSRASKGEPYILSLLATLCISLIFSIVIITSYFMFPKFIVNILFGPRFLGVIPYLGVFSFYMSIYSLNSILTHFLLSVSYYKPIIPLFLVTVLQSSGIIVFHGTILDVIKVNITTSILYFAVCILFIWQKEKSQFKKLIIGILP